MSVKTTPSPGDNNNASRMVDTTVCVPICYGSVAFALKKPKPEEYHTHQWTVRSSSSMSQPITSLSEFILLYFSRSKQMSCDLNTNFKF